MARPKKPLGDLMTDQIRIPLTADQKRLIAEAAALNALEMTAWARMILIRAAQTEPSDITSVSD
jgi:uncharacterized protein (DUF1778 family)